MFGITPRQFQLWERDSNQRPKGYEEFQSKIRIISKQKAPNMGASKLRGLDSNQRPPGYEPDELPLLYPASGATSRYCITHGKASQG